MMPLGQCKECGTRFMQCVACGNPLYCSECDKCVNCYYNVSRTNEEMKGNQYAGQVFRESVIEGAALAREAHAKRGTVKLPGNLRSRTREDRPRGKKRSSG